MKELKITDKIIKILIILSLVVIFVFCFIINISYGNVKQVKIENVEIKNEGMQYFLEETQRVGNKICLEGYVYKEGENILNSKNSILLKAENSDKYYKAPVKMVIKKDINKDEFDYSRGGFSAKINIKGIPSGKYKIYIQYQCNKDDILIQTEKEIEI